jgi:DNA polymerase III subunit epsilon
MSWHEGRLCVLDTETTGVDPETARIVTACVAHVGAGAKEIRQWLVNPGVPIPAGATKIHGITDEQAAEGADPAVAIPDIASAVLGAWEGGLPVVAFNAPYDLTVLSREVARLSPGGYLRQVEWHKAWAAQLTAYRRSTGSAEIIDTSWPACATQRVQA